CENCGSPQPENVQFELPSEQKLVTDEAALKAAQEGPDIHCPFCGTRNPASAKTCSQCGGDLTGGKAREEHCLLQLRIAIAKSRCASTRLDARSGSHPRTTQSPEENKLVTDRWDPRLSRHLRRRTRGLVLFPFKIG